MGALADHFAFVNHDNLIRMADGADSLRDDDNRGILCLRCKRLSERRVCFEVKG